MAKLVSVSFAMRPNPTITAIQTEIILPGIEVVSPIGFGFFQIFGLQDRRFYYTPPENLRRITAQCAHNRDVAQ